MPYLLQYEARITEKFIRKHIGDYSGYNHRQHVLAQILATGCHEDRQRPPSVDDYRALGDYVQRVVVQLSQPPQSVDELLAIVLPPAATSDTPGLSAGGSVPYRLITLLYCLNMAAYDLRMCDELTDMYGYREAFNCHRRAALQFIVAQCAAWPAVSPVSPQPPVLKLPRRAVVVGGVVADGISPLVAGMRVAEAERGELHRKWCGLFLAFDYSDWESGEMAAEPPTKTTAELPLGELNDTAALATMA